MGQQPTIEREDAWTSRQLHADAERLSASMNRVPREWRGPIRQLVREAYFVAEDSTRTIRERYEVSLKLDALWQRVTGNDNWRKDWPPPGWLGCIQSPRDPVFIRAVLPRQITVLPASMLQWASARVEALERAYNEAQAKASPMGRPPGTEGGAYDPTEVPSYEFLWEEP